MPRKAVVSYALEDSVEAKRLALVEGIRDCCCELRDLGVPRSKISSELEQVANDVEQGDCDA